MKKTLRILVVAVFSIFMLSGSALALSIDFAYSGVPTGVIWTNGTDFTGSGITIETLTVLGNPYGVNGSYDYPTLPALHMDFAYTAAGQNFITISDNKDVEWLRGSFSDADVLFVGGILQIWGSGSDSKNVEVINSVDDFNIPTDSVFEFFGFTICAPATSTPTTNGGTYGAYSIDITNTSVPEPASLLLLGLGLLGIGIVSRKK